jgi:sulfatase maturation enzyme AslB (radical SAM superfamily)
MVNDFIWVCEQFKNYRINGKSPFNDLEFMSWFREPDFADNYKELWELEKQLSTTKTPHFELASIWRLVRDEFYAPWLKNLGVDCIQITFFGTEKNTDRFSGRKGTFVDIMNAIELILENGIVPRILMFPFSTTIDDFKGFERIFAEIHLEERINKLGKEFILFFHLPTPDGEAFNLEKIRIRRSEAQRLPDYFIQKTLIHFEADSIEKLWKTEAELIPSLLKQENPLNENHQVPALMVTSDFNVYPNSGEIAPWCCLGNLKTDGVDAVMESYLNHHTLGLKMNHEMPVSYLARKYGNLRGDRLYATSTDLVLKWFRLEGIDSLKD